MAPAGTKEPFHPLAFRTGINIHISPGPILAGTNVSDQSPFLQYCSLISELMLPMLSGISQYAEPAFFLDQRKNYIISKLSTSSRYTQHSQSTHALSSSKSQFQTCVKNQIEGHTGIRLVSRLRTSAQRMTTNIPVGWNEHNLLLPSCVFLFPLSATDEEERLIPIYPIQD